MGGRPSLEQRFWDSVNKDAPNGCWEWTAWCGTGGYGVLRMNYRRVRAHRVVILLTTGEMPAPDQVVCHTCDNPPCVNPDHLFIGTHADNVRDMVSKGRHYRAEYNSIKTHCPQQHPYSPENTYINPNGDRRCRTCQRASHRAYKERRRQERAS